MLEDNLKALIKIQYVDSIAKGKVATQIVGKILKAKNSNGLMDHAIEMLDLKEVLDRQIG